MIAPTKTMELGPELQEEAQTFPLQQPLKQALGSQYPQSATEFAHVSKAVQHL